MSDFRVTVPSADNIEREMDWDERTGRWTASERELAPGCPWELGLAPEAADLIALERFFYLPADILSLPLPEGLSPEVLVESSHRRDRILAHRCDNCGGHWWVDRLNSDGWRRYGRSCDFTWQRGEPLTVASCRE